MFHSHCASVVQDTAMLKWDIGMTDHYHESNGFVSIFLVCVILFRPELYNMAAFYDAVFPSELIVVSLSCL